MPTRLAKCAALVLLVAAVLVVAPQGVVQGQGQITVTGDQNWVTVTFYPPRTQGSGNLLSYLAAMLAASRQGAYGTVPVNYGTTTLLGVNGGGVGTNWGQPTYNAGVGTTGYVLPGNYVQGTTNQQNWAGYTQQTYSTGRFGGNPIGKNGLRITSTFNDVRGSSLHGAVDIGVVNGTSVKAIGDGRVSNIYYSKEAGWTIEITYDNGFKSVYCHLMDFSVSIGQRVQWGQAVARSNNTGTNTTGPHLHWSMRSPSGTRIDPQKISGLTF